MASSLLNRSLGEISNQNAGGKSRTPSSGGGRASPYARPNSRNAEPQMAEDDHWKHDLYEGPLPRSGLAGLLRSGGEKVSRVLHIQNLHYEVSESELESLFAQIGDLDGLPEIKWDGSGRSLGVATVKYAKLQDAITAKGRFDGAPAKGQPIKISYDQRFVDIPTGKDGSLIGRVQGAPTLARRIAVPPKSENSLPYNASAPSTSSDNPLPPLRVPPPRGTVRPEFARSSPSDRGGRGGAGGGFGGPRGGGGGMMGGRRGSGPLKGVGGRGDRDRAMKPKTTRDLDEELEAFMNEGGSDDATNGLKKVDVEADIDMTA